MVRMAKRAGNEEEAVHAYFQYVHSVKRFGTNTFENENTAKINWNPRREKEYGWDPRETVMKH